MEIFIMDNSKMAKNMDQELQRDKMETDMKVNGKIIKYMEKV